MSEIDIDELCRFLLKTIKKLSKTKAIPGIRRDSLKFTVPIVESILGGRLDKQQSMQNAIITIDTVIVAGYLRAPDREYLEKSRKMLKSELGRMRRDTPIGEIGNLLKSSSSDDFKEGLRKLGDEVRKGYVETMEVFIDRMLSSLTNKDLEIATLASKFIYYASSFRQNIFEDHRDAILEGLKSPSSDVRAIIAMACSASRDLESLSTLPSLYSDQSVADISILNIPDYKIKFPHEETRAKLSDIVRDSIYEIVESRKDNSLYLTRSIRMVMDHELEVGRGTSLDFEITPIVDLRGLEIDLAGMQGEFDLLGNNLLKFDLLKAGLTKFVEPITLIPEREGHRKGKIRYRTENGWEVTLEVEAIANKSKKREAQEERVSQNAIVTGDVQSDKQSPALDILAKDIQSMEVTRTVNALEELARYAGDDTTLKNRIDSLKLTFSFKGTTKITKPEMDSAMELVENVKRRMYS